MLNIKLVPSGLMYGSLLTLVGSLLFWTRGEALRSPYRVELDSPGLCTLLTGHRFWVNSVAFSADGKTLASGGGEVRPGTGEIILWDVVAGRPREALPVSDDPVQAVAFTPNGRTLAWANASRDTRFWDLDAQRESPGGAGPLHTPILADIEIPPHSPELVRLIAAAKDQPHDLREHLIRVWCLAHSLDGRQLATASFDSRICVWETNNCRLQRVLAGHDESVNAVCFSPDGRTLASGGHDRTVRLWDLATGTERCRLQGHTGAVNAVAISPDGRWLASGGYDATIRLWDLNQLTDQ